LKPIYGEMAVRKEKVKFLEIVRVIDILLGLWFPLKKNHPIAKTKLDENNDEEVIPKQVHPISFYTYEERVTYVDENFEHFMFPTHNMKVTRYKRSTTMSLASKRPSLEGKVKRKQKGTKRSFHYLHQGL